MTEFDWGQVATTVVSNLLDKAATEASARLGGAIGRFSSRLSGALTGYLEQTYARVSTYRTLLNPKDSIPLLQGFTSLSIRFGKRTINEEALAQKILPGCRIVIAAPAGQGKSLLMKYLALSLFEHPSGLIPLFIELRSLNRDNSNDVLCHVYNSYLNKKKYTFDRFKEDVASGIYALIFDGFDEINPERRVSAEAEILDVSSRYQKCPIVISSRIDQSIYSWDRFTICYIMPMSKAGCIKLIKLLDYDSELKKRFLKLVDSGLYKEHASFMSNPLLTTLMLLIFEQFAQIPGRTFILYDHAFETLVRRHDAMKSQYSRAMFSRLTADEIKAVFIVFSALTYSDSVYSFDEASLHGYLERSLKYRALTADPALVGRDLLESVCLLQPDGLNVVFVHRSFQEHFTAVFLSSISSSVRVALVERYADRTYDNVISMLYSMRPELLEAEWIIPKLKSLITLIDSKNSLVSRICALIQGFEFGVLRGAWLSELLKGKYWGFYQTVYKMFKADQFGQPASFYGIYDVNRSFEKFLRQKRKTGDGRYRTEVRRSQPPAGPSYLIFRVEWQEGDEDDIVALGLERMVVDAENLCRTVLDTIEMQVSQRSDVLSHLIDNRSL